MKGRIDVRARAGTSPRLVGAVLIVVLAGAVTPGPTLAIDCTNPTEFTALVPYYLPPPQGPTELRIVGANLDALESVSLVRGAAVIPGADLSMDGDDLVATFDLTGATPGYYRLTGTRTDECGNPPDLELAFGLLCCGESTLVNGDFELFGPQGMNTPLPPEHGWLAFEGLGDLKYNSQYFGLSGGAMEGDNFGSIEFPTYAVGRAVQVVSTARDADVFMSGAIQGCTSQWTGTDWDYDHRVVIWNGAIDTTPLASFTMNHSDDCGDWIPFSITGGPTVEPIVTVEWGFVGDSPGYLLPVTHVDALSLAIVGPCQDPFADLDADLDVDQDDFALLQACYTEPDETRTPECKCADGDGDERVDNDDLVMFENCASGPDILPDPACDDPE